MMFRPQNVVFLLLALFVLLTSSYASKILFLMPLGPTSHKNFFDGIVRALADANHQVTMVSAVNRSVVHENVQNVILSKDYHDDFMGDPFESTLDKMTQKFFVTGPEICMKTAVDPLIQDSLRANYDLIIMSFTATDCFLPYIYRKNVPFIYAFSLLPTALFSASLGNLEFPSIVPPISTTITYPFSFIQRFRSALVSVFSDQIMYRHLNPRLERTLKERGFWPDDMPPIYDMHKKASLAIINTVRALQYPPRPFVSSMIFAGGIHISQPKELPKDLARFIESSGDDGFILFSLGTVVKSKYMKESHRQILLKAFSKLKQKVLFKWDGGVMDDLPENVKLSKWLPQSDILAHPKIRLFISHGGLLSAQEATYFGVPLLGIPVCSDQQFNMAHARAEGWALEVSWQELTEQVLFNAINKAMEDTSIKETAMKRSKIMRDLPMSPAKEVTYWVEYVLRHNGAEHLSCPFKHMTWTETYNIDVWVPLSIVLVICLVILVIGCCLACIRLCSACTRCCFKLYTYLRKWFRTHIEKSQRKSQRRKKNR